MNTKINLIEENMLLELTDAELKSVCGGFHGFRIRGSFNAGDNNQTTGSSNGSFGNFGSSTFGSLQSNNGGFSIGGSSNDGSYSNGSDNSF